MSAPTNHWKLGFFVVVGFALLAVVVGVLGARSLHKETVQYKTYFDESVQGLELGSPVKYRGVTVGTVAAIDVARDQRHVEVSLDFGVDTLDKLHLAERRGRKIRITVPPDLRTQLGSSGITGVKYIAIDFFIVADTPPPQLPFPVAENYIPAAPSTMKNLEDSVTKAVNKVPELLNTLLVVLTQVSAMLDDIEKRHLPDRLEAVLKNASSMLVLAETRIAALDTAKLSAKSEATLDGLNGAVGKLDTLLTKLQSDKGVFMSAQRTSDALGDVARNTKALGPGLEDTLRDISGAAQSVRRLADALERDPDMLLKGRATKK
jgi:phospholipid/cholesterol/gamma-HCH transport system substrate-binding protein